MLYYTQKTQRHSIPLTQIQFKESQCIWAAVLWNSCMSQTTASFLWGKNAPQDSQTGSVPWCLKRMKAVDVIGCDCRNLIMYSFWSQPVSKCTTGVLGEPAQKYQKSIWPWCTAGRAWLQSVPRWATGFKESLHHLSNFSLELCDMLSASPRWALLHGCLSQRR